MDPRILTILQMLMNQRPRSISQNYTRGDTGGGVATSYPATMLATNPGIAGTSWQQYGNNMPTRIEQIEWNRTGIPPWYDEDNWKQNQQESSDTKRWNAAHNAYNQSLSDSVKYWGAKADAKPEPYVPTFNRPANYHSGAADYRGTSTPEEMAQRNANYMAGTRSPGNDNSWFAPRAPMAQQNIEQGAMTSPYQQGSPPAYGMGPNPISPQVTEPSPRANRGGMTGDALDYLYTTLIPGNEQTRQNWISGSVPTDFSYYLNPNAGSLWGNMFD